MIFSFSFFLFFFRLVKTQFICVSYPYEQAASQIDTKYKKFLEEAKEKLDKTFEVEKNGTKYKFYDFIFNITLNNGKATVNFHDHSISFAPNVTTFNFNYSCEITSANLESNINMQQSVDVYYFTFIQKPNDLGPVFEIVIKDRKPEIPSDIVQGTFKENVEKLYPEISQKLSKSAALFSGSYHLAADVLNFTLSDYFEGLEYTIFNNKSCLPSIDLTGNKKKAIFFYSGNLDAEPECKPFLGYDEEFMKNEEEDKTTIFIHYKMFRNIIKKIDVAGYTLTQENKPSGFIEMNVAFLVNHFLNINYDYSTGTPFHLLIEVIRASELNKTGIEVFTINHIKIEEDEICSFNTNFKFDIEYTFNFTNLNMCISKKDISVVGIEFTNSKYKIINELRLQNMIEKVADLFFKKTEVCLFKKSINFYTFLNVIEKVEEGEKGIYIAGQKVKYRF